jgi:DNA-binding MarR family transcriptional regulator
MIRKSNEMSKGELIQAGTRQARLFQIASDKMDDAFCAEVGVNLTDARCLDLLDVLGPMTAGALAREAGVSPGAVTTVLDRLERMRLVTRTRDEADRRRVLIELTDTARELAWKAYGPIANYATPYLQGLTRGELETILRFLEVATEVNERRARELREGS